MTQKHQKQPDCWFFFALIGTAMLIAEVNALIILTVTAGAGFLANLIYATLSANFSWLAAWRAMALFIILIIGKSLIFYNPFLPERSLPEKVLVSLSIHPRLTRYKIYRLALIIRIAIFLYFSFIFIRSIIEFSFPDYRDLVGFFIIFTAGKLLCLCAERSHFQA